MALGVVRNFDIAIGISNHNIHTKHHHCPHMMMGFVISGSGDTRVNGLASGRGNDLVMHTCPHCRISIMLATSQHTVNGRKTHRLGDINVGGGAGDFTIMISSSPNVTAT